MKAKRIGEESLSGSGRAAPSRADGVPFVNERATASTTQQQQTVRAITHLSFHDKSTPQTWDFFSTVDVSHVPCPCQKLFSTKRITSDIYRPSQAGDLHSPRQKMSSSNDQFCVPSPYSRLSAPANALLLTYAVNHAV